MKTSHNLPVLSLALITAMAGATPAWAAPVLGTAKDFAVLGASAVTFTNSPGIAPATVYGDIGIAPSSAVTGGDTITLHGAIHTNDETAITAQADAASAYSTLMGQTNTQDLTGTDLGGLTLGPGVYNFAGGAALNGVLTLDAKNDRKAQFVFKIASTLTTGANALVKVLNSGASDSVYWLIGSSATLAADTQMEGNLIAITTITMTGARIACGRAIALNAAVTLTDVNTIANHCQFRHHHRARIIPQG